MTSRFFLGKLVPMLGRQRLMISTTILSAVSMAALALPLPPAAMACLVVALGLGLGVGQPLTMAWLAASTPQGREAEPGPCATAAALAAGTPLTRRPATGQVG